MPPLPTRLVTIEEIEKDMFQNEHLIAYYNKRYNFDMTKATPEENRQYDNAIKNWDFFKLKRDEFKAVKG